uniref:Uncharacterized protein n=1 Tax=Tanacetum cinerariifolium TaxID=118510 RepID=A0A699H448_TANCI|nr:hypothetical protein [Tanacetum cinerariifolium]
MILLLRSVTVLPATGNFSIPWAVGGIAWILLTPGLPIIPLYGDGDLTIMKFIHANDECSSSPIFTSSDICPSGHIISSLNPTRGVVAGIIWLLTSGQNLLKKNLRPYTCEFASVSFFNWGCHRRRRLELSFVQSKDFFWCLCEESESVLFLFRPLLTTTSPLRNVVVTFIISSTDFEILSCSRLISSGLLSVSLRLLWYDRCFESFKYTGVPFPLYPSLWNTPFSSLLNTFLLSGHLFLGDSEWPRLRASGYVAGTSRSESFLECIPYGGRGLANGSLLVSAHGEYLRLYSRSH